MWPKQKLGNEYVTDFVFLNQAPHGLEHVLVEIERADKPISRQAVHLANHTAKNQLLDWQRWIDENKPYLEKSVGAMSNPRFHLVMGRSHELDGARRRKIGYEFGDTSTRRFSTFDDVAARYEAILRSVSSQMRGNAR